MKKHAYFDRFRYILSDPLNEKINRIENSGEIIDGHLIMYNGLKVYPNTYYSIFSDILLLNNGVHEPQEEYVFNEVINNNINSEKPIMIELGSYWAFYSMSFLQRHKDGVAFLVEPDINSMNVGKNNFALNGMVGNFIQDHVGLNGFTIDTFMVEYSVPKINIVHSDIQGYEYEMLLGSINAIENKLVDYFFISTHSQELHHLCENFLIDKGYKIIGSADFENETFCYDGIIIATSDFNHQVFDLGDKSKTELISEEFLNELMKEKLIF
jgi:hypothetical protein